MWSAALPPPSPVSTASTPKMGPATRGTEARSSSLRKPRWTKRPGSLRLQRAALYGRGPRRRMASTVRTIARADMTMATRADNFNRTISPNPLNVQWIQDERPTSLNAGQLKPPVHLVHERRKQAFRRHRILGDHYDGYRDTGGPDPRKGHLPVCVVRSRRSRANKNGNSLSSPPNTAQAHALSHFFPRPFLPQEQQSTPERHRNGRTRPRPSR